MSGAVKQDAFKGLIAAAKAEAGQARLAHQSLGRDVSEAEDALAEALMAIYGNGVHDPSAVAGELVTRGIAVPSTGLVDWTAETMEQELRRLNDDFDAAYQANGFGA